MMVRRATLNCRASAEILGAPLISYELQDSILAGQSIGRAAE